MLAYDPDKAVEHLQQVDEPMRRLIERVGPCQLDAVQVVDPYTTLVRTIVYQQLAGKAAATIFGRLCATLGANPGDGLSPALVLSTDTAELRAAGLSRNKLAAIQDLSTKKQGGLVPSLNELAEMENAEIIDRLTQVRGIGRWTAEMLLLFHLGRPDVWPTTDLGIRKGYRTTYDLDALPKPKALTALGERFKPYRSVASWYLWRAADSE